MLVLLLACHLSILLTLANLAITFLHCSSTATSIPAISFRDLTNALMRGEPLPRRVSDSLQRLVTLFLYRWRQPSHKRCGHETKDRPAASVVGGELRAVFRCNSALMSPPNATESRSNPIKETRPDLCPRATTPLRTAKQFTL